jgi:hypothetical protein
VEALPNPERERISRLLVLDLESGYGAARQPPPPWLGFLKGFFDGAPDGTDGGRDG